ncbi:MAG: SDR family oxidoreductase [Desulfobulbaceae bacterium]|nr:SDR family oxidoreductase [Desulfobulbaceae bacterium]
MKMQNRYALVPGASRQVGRAMARALAAEGMRLILPYYDWPEDCEEMIKEFGSQHLTIRVDLRQPDAVKTLVEKVSVFGGKLHVLVNNIERGGMPVVHGSYEREVNQDQWLLEQETTLRAKWLLFQNFLPLLRKSREAVVINISSIAAISGRSGPAGLLFSDGYAAANRAIGSMTENWARIGAPTIRVNEIMLGLIDHRHGEGTRGWALLTEEEKIRLLDHTLLGRTGKPEEVAKTLLHMVRDCDYMTGTTIRLDGGYILGGEKTDLIPPGVI